MTRILYLWAMFATCVMFDAIGAAPQNLALNKSYTLAPAPSYQYCTDPDDVIQLTDGQNSSGRFWMQRSTVGWINARRIAITVDLGSIQPISGVSYNTAAGVAEVAWPQAIIILVSDDGHVFHSAGELVRLSKKADQPPLKGYAVHCYSTEELQTHGRYVAFLVTPSGPYTFVDEIEVFKGSQDFLKFPFQDYSNTNFESFFALNETRLGIERRIHNDVRSVRGAAETTELSAKTKNEILGDLDAAESEVLGLPWPPEIGYRTILPLNRIHERVFQNQARLWRAAKAPELSVWQASSYAPLSTTQSPPLAAVSRLDVSLMQNEYRGAALNVANATDSATELRMQIVGLPGGTNPPYISVHKVLWTDTKSGIPVADALKEVEQQTNVFLIDAFAGLPQQVWLTFHPTNVPSGVYSGSVLISGANMQFSFPLTLHLYPLHFPDVPALHLGGWDYSDSDAILDIGLSNRDAVITILRDHFVDSPWATSAALAQGKYDSANNMAAYPETQRFDRWLERWPCARQYCVFVNAGGQFDKSKSGTKEFDKKIGIWIRFWAEHIKDRGLSPNQLVLLLVDEPAQTKQDENILAWAKAIRTAHAGVEILENPCHVDPAEANQEMMAACNVLCPLRPSFLEANQRYRDYYVKRQEQGTELAFYSCSGPATALDPYSYYRLQAWSCWQYGAKSSYFWAFSDAGGGSSWNEYSAKGNTYVPFFLDATSVTPAKQMEALREGVEDYEYLAMLRRQLAEAERSGTFGTVLDQGKKLLLEAPLRVCNASGANAFKWTDEKDRTVADKVRIEILETLTALQSAEK